jgi:hypothetical protein
MGTPRKALWKPFWAAIGSLVSGFTRTRIFERTMAAIWEKEDALEHT